MWLEVALPLLLVAGAGAPTDSVASCQRAPGWLPRFQDSDFAHLPARRRPGDPPPTGARRDSIRRAWDAQPPTPTGRISGSWLTYRDEAGQVTYFVTQDSIPIVAHILGFERGEQVQLRYAPGIVPEDRLRWVARHDFLTPSGRGHSVDWVGRDVSDPTLSDVDVVWAERRVRVAVGACGGVPRAALSTSRGR